MTLFILSLPRYYCVRRLPHTRKVVPKIVVYYFQCMMDGSWV